jgi:hypothetical protein
VTVGDSYPELSGMAHAKAESVHLKSSLQSVPALSRPNRLPSGFAKDPRRGPTRIEIWLRQGLRSSEATSRVNFNARLPASPISPSTQKYHRNRTRVLPASGPRHHQPRSSTTYAAVAVPAQKRHPSALTTMRATPQLSGFSPPNPDWLDRDQLLPQLSPRPARPLKVGSASKRVRLQQLPSRTANAFSGCCFAGPGPLEQPPASSASTAANM